MRDHIKILGVLNIVMGCLTALIGVAVLLLMGTIAGLIASSLPSADASDFRDHAAAAPIVAMVAIGVAIFFFALALPSILGGWGLLHFRPWSRILVIVLSVFHLFHIPLGTALGVYGLWVLLSEDTRRILESGGAILNAPGPREYYGTLPPSYNPPPPAAPSL
jgi:hypothetical protein